jgi:hypothetical protein
MYFTGGFLLKSEKLQVPKQKERKSPDKGNLLNWLLNYNINLCYHKPGKTEKGKRKKKKKNNQSRKERAWNSKMNTSHLRKKDGLLPGEWGGLLTHLEEVPMLWQVVWAPGKEMAVGPHGCTLAVWAEVRWTEKVEQAHLWWPVAETLLPADSPRPSCSATKARGDD